MLSWVSPFNIVLLLSVMNKSHLFTAVLQTWVQLPVLSWVAANLTVACRSDRDPMLVTVRTPCVTRPISATETYCSWPSVPRVWRDPSPLHRQYDRLVKQMKPDMEAYEAKKEAMGDAFYAGPGAIVHGHHKDSKEAIDRLAEDVNKQWVPWDVDSSDPTARMRNSSVYILAHPPSSNISFWAIPWSRNHLDIFTMTPPYCCNLAYMLI